jgi:hypothetical protein
MFYRFLSSVGFSQKKGDKLLGFASLE